MGGGICEWCHGDMYGPNCNCCDEHPEDCLHIPVEEKPKMGGDDGQKGEVIEMGKKIGHGGGESMNAEEAADKVMDEPLEYPDLLRRALEAYFQLWPEAIQEVREEDEQSDDEVVCPICGYLGIAHHDGKCPDSIGNAHQN